MSKLILLYVLVFALGETGVAWASVPDPTVSGPIVSGQLGNPSRDYPFGATNLNLAKSKYVEEEYFLTGNANQYNLTTGAILSSGNPYRTRMLVRKPTKASQFNGTVIIEPLNAAFGFDMDAAWARSHDFLISEGYAWIGVTVDSTPANQLNGWSSRYQLLITNNNYRYDIISQATQAARNPLGIDPMQGLSVERVILTGFSTQANTVTAYHNAIQQNANVIDGFMITNGGGTTRTDLPDPVPVVRLLSETEVTYSFLANSAQIDSDFFRLWEVAGANHYDTQTNDYLAPIFMRDGVSGPNLSVCDDPNVFSLIPFYKVQNAVIDGLNRWISDGTAIPLAPRIEVDGSGVVRDSDGNSLGGIQLAEQEVATATNTQQGFGPGGLCFLAGAHAPFSQQRLDELYRNHGGYVSKVISVNDRNVDAGYLLKADAKHTAVQSATSHIGK